MAVDLPFQINALQLTSINMNIAYLPFVLCCKN